MGDFVFQVPWWVIAALVGGGIAVFVFGNRRLQDGVRNLGAGLVVLALVWAVVSYLVETDLEQVDGNARQLVRLVVAQDETGIRGLLHPWASAGAWNADDIARGTVYYARLFSLSGAHVLSSAPQRRGRDISQQLVVLSEHGGYPVKSVWQLDWQPERPGVWRLRTITPVEVGEVQQDALERQYLEHPVAR